VACQRRKLAAGIVGSWFPLLDGANPLSVVLGERRKGVDEVAAGLCAKLADHRPGVKKIGMLLDVEEKPQEGVSDIAVKRCEGSRDRNELRVGEIRRIDFAVGVLENDRSGMA
jgi:hypothetical protein